MAASNKPILLTVNYVSGYRIDKVPVLSTV
jgi:hypothetical protein